jgi:hypothetical protein
MFKVLRLFLRNRQEEPCAFICACADLAGTTHSPEAGALVHLTQLTGVSRLKSYQPARHHGLDLVSAYVCSLAWRASPTSAGRSRC